MGEETTAFQIAGIQSYYNSYDMDSSIISNLRLLRTLHRLLYSTRLYHKHRLKKLNREFVTSKVLGVGRRSENPF